MASSLSDKATRLFRQKWTDPDLLAKEIFLILRGEDDAATTPTTTTTSSTSSPTTLSGSAEIQEFTLVSPHYDKDYIQCTDSNGETKYLAKPSNFRPSVWQNQISTLSNVMLGTRFCNFQITYGSLSADENQRRTKTRSQLVATPSDIIETIFTESILPFYKIGDRIYGIRISAGLGFLGGDGVDIEWLDINVDGRSWRPDSNLQAS